MSGLAKAFVVINLILAIFFLGVSSTLFQVQEGWKKTSEDVAANYEDHLAKTEEAIQKRDGTISQLRNTQDGLTADKNELESQKTLLEDQIRDMRSAIAQKDIEKTSADERINILEGQIDNFQKTVSDKENAIAQLTREKADADEERKAAVAARNRAILDLQEVAKDLENTSIELAEVTRANQENETLIQMAIQRGVDMTDIVGVPKIDAVVAAVQDGIVILSVGRDDGVEVGYEFDVYHGKNYIGKVRVENVLDDMAGASILYTNENRTIQTGHKASTRLAG